MIDPTELRIGNLVSDRGIPGEITQTDFADKPLMRRIEPINLTPEWLERFGFDDGVIDNSRWRFVVAFNDCWHIAFSEKQGYGDSEVYLSGYWHLHQLQNLYFALTRQELKITE